MPSSSLTFFEKINRHSIFLDPENVFWAAVRNNGRPCGEIPREIASLYNKVKKRIDAEIKDFRFGTELTAVYMDATERCNARCPYCYIPQKLRKSGAQMTREELFRALDKIADYFSGRKKKAVVIFHAAEPLLLKKNIFDAVVKFKKHLKFGLQTNGTLLEKEDISFLREERVGVGISLDSPTAGANNKSRPMAESHGGNFRKAVRAIEAFDGYPGLNVISTMTKFNIAGLPRLVKFLHERRVPCLLANPVRLTQKSANAVKPDEKLMTRYFLKAVDTAIALSQQTSRRIIIANFTNIILGIVAPSARRLMCDISPCGGGRCFFTVTATGDMIPCGEFIGLKGFSGGNIFTTSIPQAMGSEAFRKVRSRTVEVIDECRACLARNICGAPCPAELQALGAMRQKAVFCDFYKKIIFHAFKLIVEEKEKYCFRENAADSLSYQYALQ